MYFFFLSSEVMNDFFQQSYKIIIDSVLTILLMEEILHQLIGSLSHYL